MESNDLNPFSTGGPPDCVLAVDLGSSGMRAALIDRDGRVIARESLALEIVAESSGVSEADPGHWWDCLQRLADRLAVAAPAAWGRVAALAISAFTRCQVLVGADGALVRPALMWRDARSAGMLAALATRCPDDHPERAQLNAFHPLARLAWLQANEPDSLRDGVTVLEPKDFLNLRLTGLQGGDPVSCARLLACAQAASGTSLFDAARLPVSLLPDMREPLAIVGPVRRGLDGALARLAGAPVVTMAHDTWASVVGLGAMRANFAYNLSGTTEVFGLIGDQPGSAEGLLCVDWGGGRWQLGGPSQSGADAVLWLASLIAGLSSRPADAGARLDALLGEPRQPEPVLFLPYLQGERVPWWDPDLRAAFVGLNRRHGRGDLAWAVIEGLAFLNRIVLERAERSGVPVAREIRFGGGGAASQRWRQVKADVLGRDILCPAPGDEGLRGAAIAAWAAVGEYPDLDAAQRALVPSIDPVRPDPARVDSYSRLYQLFCETGLALAPISRQLARWGGKR